MEFNCPRIFSKKHGKANPYSISVSKHDFDCIQQKYRSFCNQNFLVDGEILILPLLLLPMSLNVRHI
jgi:hypothetical protein